LARVSLHDNFAGCGAFQFRFYFLINPAVCKFRRNPDGVLDGIGVRPAVADNTDAFHAQQGSAAVLGIIHPLAEVAVGLLRKHIAELARDRRFERLAQHTLHHLNQSFAYLERDVSDEAIADHHVG